MNFWNRAIGGAGPAAGVTVGALLAEDMGDRARMATASGLTSLYAGLVAAFAPADPLGPLIVALALPGRARHRGLTLGATLLVDATVPANRARVRSAMDVLVALGGARRGAVSGVVVAGAGYAASSLSGGVLTLLLIPVLLKTRRAVQAVAPFPADDAAVLGAETTGPDPAQEPRS